MRKDPIKDFQARIKLQGSFGRRMAKFLRKRKTQPIRRKAKGKDEYITIKMPCGLKWFCKEYRLPYENCIRLIKMAHIGEMKTLQRIDSALKDQGV